MSARSAVRFARALSVAALAVGSACSRSSANPAGSASASPPAPVASASASAGGTFGAFCVDDSACASGVCFHKRIKGASTGPERRGANDPVEHDGYCSMHCNTDADCPSPPSNGRCGARGMCKRPE